MVTKIQSIVAQGLTGVRIKIIWGADGNVLYPVISEFIRY